MRIATILLAVTAAAGPVRSQTPIKVFDLTGTLGGTNHALEIAREPASSQHNVMIGHRTGTNLKLVLCNDDYTAPTVVASLDLTAPIVNSSIGYAVGANRWVVAIHELYQLKIYVHDFANLTPNSGTTITLGSGAGSFGNVMIGAAETGTTALAAFSRVTSGGNVSYSAFPVHAALATIGAIFPIVQSAGSSPGLDAVFHAMFSGLTPVGDGTGASWVLAWRDSTSSPSIRAAHVLANGIVSPPHTIVGVPPGYGRLRVAGRGGRYLVAYSQLVGSQVPYRRFDWPQSASAPTLLSAGFLGLGEATARGVEDIAFDRNTDSHWAVTWRGDFNTPIYPLIRRAGVARIAADGAIIEKQTVWQSSAAQFLHAALTFNSASGCFPIAYRAPSRTNPTNGAIWVKTLCNRSANFGYGKACAGNLAADVPPVAGSTDYTVRLENAPPNVAAFLSVGRRRTALDLSPFGMTGCTRYVDDVTIKLPARTDGSGRAAVSFPIPSGFRGDLYAQWTFDHPLAPWRTKVATTQGLAASVR